MSRRWATRVVVLVLGLVLGAGGLTLVDWQQERVLDLPARLRLGSVLETLDRSWWPWAQGGAGVVLVLLGLLAVASYLPGRGPRTLPAAEAEPTGTVDLELASLGAVLTHQLEKSGTTTGARAVFHRARGRLQCVVDGRLTADADLDSVVSVAEEAAADLARAVPGDALGLQLRWGASRRAPSPRSPRGHVRLE